MLFRLVSAFVVAAFATAHHANAAPLWGTDATGELTGSRNSSSSGGIDGNSSWDNGNFKISWTITENDGLWTYVYKITTKYKELSHWILEVTEGVPFNVFDCTSTFTGPDDGWKGSPSNPLMPNDLYGVKFDAGTGGNDDGLVQYYTIVTDRDPVYGVAYFKDGKSGGTDVVAWTNALNYSNYKTITSLTYKDYIVRPDGTNGPPDPGGGAQVPEPAAAVLLILGTGAMALVRHRRETAT